MPNNSFDCLNQCPYVWDCLAVGEVAGMAAAQVDQMAVDVLLRSVEIEGAHTDIIEDRLARFEAMIKQSGDETALANLEEIKKRLTNFSHKHEDSQSWKERRIAETRDVLGQEAEAAFQDAEDAMATCLAGPQLVKRWRFFGRHMITCTSPQSDGHLYYETE